MALGMGLLYGPRGGCVLMSELPLIPETYAHGPMEVLGGERFFMSEVPLYAIKNTHRSRILHVQGLLEHKVHHAVGAYSRPMPLGP